MAVYSERDAKVIQFIYFIAIVLWVWAILAFGFLSYTWLDYILYYPPIVFLINIYGVVGVSQEVIEDTTINPSVANVAFLIFGAVSYFASVEVKERKEGRFNQVVAGVSLALLSQFGFYVADSAIPYLRTLKSIFNIIGLTLIVHAFGSFMITVGSSQPLNIL